MKIILDGAYGLMTLISFVFWNFVFSRILLLGFIVIGLIFAINLGAYRDELETLEVGCLLLTI